MASTNTDKIKHIVAIMSGKGGTGKSVITSLLATSLQSLGHRVGILDGDLTDPTIRCLFGVKCELSLSDAGGIEPLSSSTGVEMMSMDMFLGDENTPLGWQGPMISSALKQFYKDTEWGQLDYLLIDLPPCSSDATLTVLQSFPLDGVIIVASPQVVVTKGVKKCINLVYQLNGTIIGVVENMVHFETPMGESYAVYGPSCGDELAAMADAPLLAQFPFDTKLTALCDAGRIEEYHAESCNTLATNFIKALEARDQTRVPS
jgi:Mrp family chromosome partitioning ATPase